MGQKKGNPIPSYQNQGYESLYPSDHHKRDMGTKPVMIDDDRNLNELIDSSSWQFTSGYAKDTDLTDGSINARFNTLTANEYHVTVLTSSILFASGSNYFGNTEDDIHHFTGSVHISGHSEFGGDLVPKLAQGATLGSIDRPFRELFLQSGSISIESDTPGDPSAIISNRNENLEISIGGMRLVEPAASFIAPTGSFDYISVSGSMRMTGSLYITGSIKNVSSIDFDTTQAVTPNVEGRLTWNTTDGTLNLGLKGGNVTLQVGQEQIVRVVNKSGAYLLESEYKVVRVRTQAEGGAQGQRLAVVNALATNDLNSATTLGVVTENISVNQEGFITTFGFVNGINTSGTLQGENWDDGDTLYLSPTTSGGLTKVKPTAPDHMVVMGYVVYAHPTQGKIFVKVDNGYELDELHNIHIYENTLVGNAKTTGGSTLYYSGSVWTNNENVRFTETNAILARVSSSLNFVNDTAAAAGGVPLGGLYRNGNAIQIRLV